MVTSEKTYAILKQNNQLYLKMKMVQTEMTQSESWLGFIIPLVGLSPRVPARCSGQSCKEQREQRDNGFKER